MAISADEMAAGTWDQPARAVITIGAASARNGSDLPAGAYYVVFTSAGWYLQGDSTVVAVAGSSNYVSAGGAFIMKVNEGEAATKGRLAVIQDSSGGSAIIMRPR
jgi:hypothetical protein